MDSAIHHWNLEPADSKLNGRLKKYVALNLKRILDPKIKRHSIWQAIPAHTPILLLDITSLHLLVWGSGNKVDRTEVCIPTRCTSSISVSQPFRNKVGEEVTSKLFCLLHYYLKNFLAKDSKFSVIFWNTQTYAFQIITASGSLSISRYQYI